MAKQPVISVVVCTHNRSELLRLCLESLVTQDLEKDAYEIIVVNNASTDATEDVLEQFSSTYHFLRSIYEPVAGLSRARNVGWKAAKSGIAGFIDDDAIAAPQWLRTALWSFRNFTPVPDVLTGPIILYGETVLPNWIEGEFKTPLGYLYWGDKKNNVTGTGKTIIGANCFFSKEALERFSGFDEDLGRKKKLLLSGEEVQVQAKIERSGGAVWYHPEVTVQHYVPRERTFPSWYYKRFYWGGVTDYIMTRQNKKNPVDGYIKDETYGQSREQVGGGVHGQIKRLFRNLFDAVGIFSSTKDAIHARIYMAYVWGYLSSALLHVIGYSRGTR